MEIAFGGVLVTIFLAGFGYLATEIKGVRESMDKGFTGSRNEISGLRTEFKADLAEFRTEFKAELAELRTELAGEIRSLTERYIAHLEWHQGTG